MQYDQSDEEDDSVEEDPDANSDFESLKSFQEDERASSESDRERGGKTKARSCEEDAERNVKSM